jgi:acyl-CoA synthetase (AMP-forming)/AMP-acid ligase II
VLYTSGTSGTAKGVVHAQEGLVARQEAFELTRREVLGGSVGRRVLRALRLLRRYRTRLLRPAVGRQVWMTPIPFSSIGGLSVLLQALFAGQRVVTTASFLPRDVLRLVERERVTVLVLTPTMAELILRTSATANASSLLVVGLGGSYAKPSLAERLRERFGCAVAIGYGSTELGGGVLATNIADSDAQQFSTVGRPFPGSDVRVVDEHRDELPHGEVGELACRTPGMMRGYLSGGERGDCVVDGGEWIYTGDLAVMDDDGFVRIVGRKRETLVRGGYKIHPIEIEDRLEALPGVAEAAVVGVPDDVFGERICAFVVPEPGAELAPNAVKKESAAELASYKVPDEVRVVSELPRTPSGKVQRYVLRRAASEPRGADR